MKKTLFSILITTGVLFAQNNTVSNNSFNSNGGDININQSNKKISNEEININKKIDKQLLKLLNSNFEQSDKSFLSSLLNQSKNINALQVSINEKNRQCKFKAKIGAEFLKFGNLNLAFSYCDKIF